MAGSLSGCFFSSKITGQTRNITSLDRKHHGIKLKPTLDHKGVEKYPAENVLTFKGSVSGSDFTGPFINRGLHRQL